MPTLIALIGRSAMCCTNTFTYKTTYIYTHVLSKYANVYIDTVHSTTRMASLRVTDADVLVVWIFYGGQEASPSICACQIWRRAAVRIGKKR